jgi:ATP-binding cassette subfamily F protein uup
VVKRGTNLQVAYFDQLREQLDPERTLAETVNPGSDWVEVGESRKHISSYLNDFLFDSRRANAPIRMLSGGERNRLLLARLFARPANMLVLDEPTNDLDIDSLELLETMLLDYTGTLLLVSHDRTFLDNVVTQTVAAEGAGQWHDYVGGYTDWLRQRALPRAASVRRPSPAPAVAPAPVAAAPKRKLSFKEQRELDSLPGEIERLEREQLELTEKSCLPDYHKAGAEQMRRDRERATELATLISASMERWERLEALASSMAAGRS